MSAAGAPLASADVGGQRGLTEETPIVEQKPRVRLHHLDWLRAICIGFAVYLHVFQTFEETGVPPAEVKLDTAIFPLFREGSTGYKLLNQDLPQEEWKNGVSRRYIMIGMQFVIPMLFWISGYALGLGKEKATSSLTKILAITVLGMAANAVIYSLGPMDDACSWYASQNELSEYCGAKGLLLSFKVGIGQGWLLAILGQFWFTAMMVVFLAEAHLAVEGLRELNKEGDTGTEPSAAKYLCGYWLLTAFVYIAALSFWNSTPEHPRGGVGVVLAIAELPFIAVLALCVKMPAERPKTVRVLQYTAALLALLQFCIPQLQNATIITKIDGGIAVYFHFFKQLFLIGFVMALTRTKTAPVSYQYFPAVLILVFLTAAPTNYYRAGGIYPYFPRVQDRLFWSIGTVVQLFIHDRLGQVAGAAGALQPLPAGLGTGMLVAYVFQYPMIVLFAPLANTIGTGGMTILIVLLCSIPLGIMESRKKEQ